MSEQKPLPNGWRLSEPYAESKQADYVKRVVKELSEIPRIKTAKPTHFNGKLIADLTPAEREEFYFSQQPESTKQAILRQKERKPWEDIDYLLRPMPDCIANPEAKSLDELTAKRAIDPEDALREKALKTGRNTLGESKESSVDKDKRQTGIEAFTYSKPATVSDNDLKRIAKLKETDAVLPTESPKSPEKLKRPWWMFWKKKEFNPDEWDLHKPETWRCDVD